VNATLKLATIVGARPQFVKAAVVSRAIRLTGNGNGGRAVQETLIHTGQHYDASMSQVFFDQLGMEAPRYNLAIGSGNHGEQTGRMLSEVERVLLAEHPDWVLVYGDTNSTLAGALAAAKLNLPIAHVEAGLRDYNRKAPEEINRIVADHLSQLLFVPTETALRNLEAEGITDGVHLIGDVMQDALAEYTQTAQQKSTLLRDLGLVDRDYLLATIHRAENTDDHDRFAAILRALRALAENNDVVWPVHPRTRKHLSQFEAMPARVHLLGPASYLDMLALERSASIILTDSGGVQKEARWLNVPCVTLREETSWVETLQDGWNRLAGADTERILAAAAAAKAMQVDRATPVSRSGAAYHVANILARQY